MSKSPLSGAFAGSSEPAKKNKKNGALLLISGIALATSIGGVFAANSITINGGAAIEFGQGVASTSSCDANLTTSIEQTWNETEDVFRVSNVVVGGIDDDACSNTTLRVALLNAAGGELDSFTFTGDAATETSDRSSRDVNADLVKRITVTTQN
jgi:hypothetical protein